MRFGRSYSYIEFTVIRGDIVDQSADALVNAAGTSREMGSGVAGALRRAAGRGRNREAVEKRPTELAEAAVTDAYAIDADYVVHAAAMPHYDDGKATATSIREATDDYEPKTPSEVRFIAYGDSEFETVRAVIAEFRDRV